MTLDELYLKYPRIFEQMKDGYYAISSSLPSGWIKTVDFLCESIQNYTDNINNNNKHLPQVPQTVVDQVKEKFAGLRFYFHGGDDAIEGMVEMAETICSHTCMDCGNEGKFIDSGGWYYTLCDECYKQYKR